MVITLNFVSAAAALVAAFLWYRASTVQVPHSDKPDESGWTSASIQVGKSDFVKTGIEQTRWSKRGAIAAAIAAASQGIALLIQACQQSAG